jgi:recombination protein RecT
MQMNEPIKSVAVQKKRDIRDLLNSEGFRAEIAKVLPKHLTPERMTRVALTAFLKTPKLMECSPESLTNALLVCSQAGLEPDGRLAHLIPYGNVVQVIFDYKGLVALAIRNGMEAVFADVVCEEDFFEASVENGVKKLTHRPDFRKSRGETVCFYAVCQRNGVVDWEVMSVEEVNGIRERSKAKNSGPWVTDYAEMGKKTVLRRMSKRWDLLPEIRDIIYADDDSPGEIKQVKVSKPLFESPRLPDPVPEPAPDPDAGLQPTDPAAPEASEAGNKGSGAPTTGNTNSLRGVRNLCKMAKLSESKLLAFLQATRISDGSQASLDELPQDVLLYVFNDFSKIKEAIQAEGVQKEELL